MEHFQEVLDKLANSLEKLENVVREKQEENQSLKAQVEKMTTVVTQAYERIDKALARLEETDGNSQLQD